MVRTDYKRVYYLIPEGASPEQERRVFEVAWYTKSTIGWSSDDAGIGDLTDKTVIRCIFKDAGFDDPSHRDFYGQHYPGTKVVDLFMDGVEPDPEPEPEPNPEPAPEPIRHRSGNYIGLHSSYMAKYSKKYVVESGTNCQKFFSAGDCLQAKQWAPDMITVWRKFVGNEGGRIHEKGTIEESAVWYLDQYSEELETAARNLGIGVNTLLQGIDGIESLNETIPTFNVPHLEASVHFDKCFADALYKRYGDRVRPVLLNGAVGNPHETEVQYLLPAAKAAYKYNGWIGYHDYWTGNRNQTFLKEHWQYHAGRWTIWDTYFVKNGVYPHYLSTEGGIVYAPDGVNFNSGRGWKSCGDIKRYISELELFNTLVTEWNKSHNNRFDGLTIFCYGQFGWGDFLLGDGDVLEILEWAKSKGYNKGGTNG